jgi:hypothetical protein
VLGLTIASACAQGKNRLKTTNATFAAGVEGELPPQEQILCDDFRASLKTDTNQVSKNRQHDHDEGTQTDLLQSDEADVSKHVTADRLSSGRNFSGGQAVSIEQLRVGPTRT